MQKMPAVRARHEPEMDRELVGQRAALGDLHGIDVADQVGDRDVGRGELLDVAVVAVQPGDLAALAVLREQRATARGDRRKGVVVDLAAGDLGDPLVEQPGERADHPRLRLSALAEEDQVVSAQQRVLERRQHRVLVAEHALAQALARAQPRQQVGAQLFAHAARRPTGGAQLGERARGGGARSHGMPLASTWLLGLGRGSCPSGSRCGVE